MSDSSEQVSVEHTDGVVLLRNRNTTIGYCRYRPSGDIEYLFVNPLYRRQGHGSRLLAEVKSHVGHLGQAEPPISPLGRAFFSAHGVSVAPQEDAAC